MTSQEEIARWALLEAADILDVDPRLGGTPHAIVKDRIAYHVRDATSLADDRGAIVNSILVKADVLFKTAAGAHTSKPYAGWWIPRDHGDRPVPTIEILREAAEAKHHE